MVELSRILNAECIKLNLDSKRKTDVIKEMVFLLFRAGKIKNPQEIGKAILEREKLGTTGIGEGIAIPHAMTDQVTQTMLAFGRNRKGVKFNAVDQQPVKLIFLMIGPHGQESTHLKFLSKLSRFLNDDRFKSALMEAEREEDVLNVFLQKETEE